MAQKELIESIEQFLRTKFPTVKGYLIGSHAYNIAMGGLATIDFYLDLRKLTKYIKLLLILEISLFL